MPWVLRTLQPGNADFCISPCTSPRKTLHSFPRHPILSSIKSQPSRISLDVGSFILDTFMEGLQGDVLGARDLAKTLLSWNLQSGGREKITGGYPVISGAEKFPRVSYCSHLQCYGSGSAPCGCLRYSPGLSTGAFTSGLFSLLHFIIHTWPWIEFLKKSPPPKSTGTV